MVEEDWQRGFLEIPAAHSFCNFPFSHVRSGTSGVCVRISGAPLEDNRGNISCKQNSQPKTLTPNLEP